MKTIRSAAIGILAALGSGILVLSALSFGLLEGFMIPIPTVTLRPTLPLPNLTPIAQVINTPTVPPTSLPATQTVCPKPKGWDEYLVQSGDQLAGLAQSSGITLAELMRANCLFSEMLVPGTIIYLPPLSTTTPTFTVTQPATHTPQPVVCSPPPGWVTYTVQPGDTLFQISRLFRVSVWQLRQANCLVGDLIRTGSKIWVPNVATSTFTFTPIEPTQPPTATAAPSLTNTGVPPMITATPSRTPTSLPSPTQTFMPTATTTSTVTPTFTLTPSPTATDTETPAPTSTATDVPTPTETPENP